ncbi:MAG: prepilin peptidase [Candidatus Parcubacteria bacterium]|nr:prepilin peptidase [Candidatus Parcubacteria bacterium]
MIISSAFFFLLGIISGSFLNCCLYRLAEKVPLWGRSFCPHCRKKLFNRDLVPLFSYVWLKGKCRFCQKPIGSQSFFIELATGLLFILFFIKYGAIGWFLARDLFFVLILMFILVFDWRHYIILDQVIWPALVFIFIFNICLGNNWQDLIIAGLIGAGFFFLQHLVSGGKWIGWGDIKLGLLLGIMLGLKYLILAILLAYIIGGMIAMILLLTKMNKIGDLLPMGSFLAGAAIIVSLWGDKILSWYF